MRVMGATRLAGEKPPAGQHEGERGKADAHGQRPPLPQLFALAPNVLADEQPRFARSAADEFAVRPAVATARRSWLRNRQGRVRFVDGAAIGGPDRVVRGALAFFAKVRRLRRRELELKLAGAERSDDAGKRVGLCNQSSVDFAVHRSLHRAEQERSERAGQTAGDERVPAQEFPAEGGLERHRLGICHPRCAVESAMI